MKITVGILLAVGIVAGVHADSITHSNTTINMEFVDIGDAGNPANLAENFDGTNPGSVPHNYRIGKYEVTIRQFMQAHSADNLVSDGDEDVWNSGLSVFYMLGLDAPATEVSFYEAAKFCNWLTSGSAYTGAYNIVGSGPLRPVDHRNIALQKFDVVYVIPSLNEPVI